MDIDVDEESVLSAIFKDAFPESWQNDPNFIHYLSELSSYGVEKLAQEPDRLCEEKTQILEETQNLAFQNYKTFIQTAECSREIFEDFQIIEQHVENVLSKLPVFSEDCSQVLKKAQDISSSRRMNTLTLQRHTQLLEILELPQLMDTCVRNGYYDEALELASHVKRLEKKHSNIPVIVNIVNEVKTSTQLMLNQLIQQLRTNIQLPACLRVIGYLRRMDVFTEVELRIKFLQARDSWFLGILDNIPKEDAFTHITKTIEASRVNLFDIITQYRAIFSDEDPLLSTSKDDSLNESSLFHSWIVQKVSQFLTSLRVDLSHGVGGRLDSILGQCMYFGLSFSRVGADFRGLLTPIFQQAALSGLQLALDQANKRFEDNMRSYSLLSSTGSMAAMSYNPVSQTGQLYPPTTLLDYYPLAAYCNDILTALNELRLCAPVAMVTEVSNCLHNSFVNVNRVILAFHRAEETTFDSKEREMFDQFCSAYGNHLAPYINRCLQALFPQTQLAQTLGMTVSELHKLGGLGQVNLKSALQSVSHLIPDAEPEPIVTPLTSGDDVKEPIITPVTSGDDVKIQAATSLDTDSSSSQPESSLQTESTSSPAVDQSNSLLQNDVVVTESNVNTDDKPSEVTNTDTPIPAIPAVTVDRTESSGPDHVDITESTADVKFSLSDSEDHDIETNLANMNLDNAVVDTGVAGDDIDIGGDLDALAADVLGTKSNEKKD